MSNVETFTLPTGEFVEISQMAESTYWQGIAWGSVGDYRRQVYDGEDRATFSVTAESRTEVLAEFGIES